jgi:polysaccharide deacetylase 2 family uncharacterized protein YibQ
MRTSTEPPQCQRGEQPHGFEADGFFRADAPDLYHPEKTEALFCGQPHVGRHPVPTVGRTAPLPFAERDVFIDHEQTPAFVKKQLKLLIKRANRQGYAIGIAHPHPVTLEVLKEMLPELKKAVF